MTKLKFHDKLRDKNIFLYTADYDFQSNVLLLL